MEIMANGAKQVIENTLPPSYSVYQYNTAGISAWGSDLFKHAQEQATGIPWCHKHAAVDFCTMHASYKHWLCDLQIEQLESEFGFGTSVDGFLLTYNQEYRDTFLDNFAVSIDLSRRFSHVQNIRILRIVFSLFGYSLT